MIIICLHRLQMSPTATGRCTAIHLYPTYLSLTALLTNSQHFFDALDNAGGLLLLLNPLITPIIDCFCSVCVKYRGCYLIHRQVGVQTSLHDCVQLGGNFLGEPHINSFVVFLSKYAQVCTYKQYIILRRKDTNQTSQQYNIYMQCCTNKM